MFVVACLGQLPGPGPPATWSMRSRGTGSAARPVHRSSAKDGTARPDQCFTAARLANVAAIQPAMKVVKREQGRPGRRVADGAVGLSGARGPACGARPLTRAGELARHFNPGGSVA